MLFNMALTTPEVEVRKVHDETAVFRHVVPMGDTRAVMRVAGVADGIDVPAAGVMTTARSSRRLGSMSWPTRKPLAGLSA
jgi:hypothetical protein